MNEEVLNMSLRKFLKVVGVTSQQEIEKAIRAAVADDRLKGTETIGAQMGLHIDKVGLSHKMDDEISLGSRQFSTVQRGPFGSATDRDICPVTLAFRPQIARAA